MKNFSSLLFELSSIDRLDILFLLHKSPTRLSHISKKLNFTVQETSRNMTRLTDAKIISRDTDGLFHLTPYGKEALNLLSGFRFLFDNSSYFETHTLDKVPNIFRTSLGVLDRCESVSDVMISFHNVEKMITEAKEFVWILTDQILVSTIPYLIQAIQSGTQFRLMMPQDYIPTSEIRELVDHPIFEKASRNKKLENRFLEGIDVFLCLSEREVGALAFPTHNGQFDYTGFRAENESIVEWSKIMFDYYWKKASTMVPEQLRQVK